MTTEHPITPPPALVEQWIAQIWHEGTPVKVAANDLHVATQAARWGADQELLAARRPKLPSLAEEALTKINAILSDPRKSTLKDEIEALELSRRALERLKELEKGNE